MDDPNLRISDAEREQAAAELGEHYAQGRLDADEHAERLDRIWAARTRGELTPIFVDLPGHLPGHLSGRPPRPAPARAPRTAVRERTRAPRRGLPFPLVALLAVLVLVTVVTHLPIILVGLGVWFLLARGHCGGRQARRPHWS